MIRRNRTALPLALLFAAAPALAHVDGAPHGSFVAGLLHPLTGIDHLVALVALGLLAARHALRTALAWVGIGLAALALGAWSGSLTGTLQAGELLIAASVLAGGAALVRSRTASGAWGLALVAAFAAAHGHAHGVETAGTFGSTLAGLVATSAAVTTAAIGVGHTLLAHRTALRWIGLAIAATGAGFAIPALIG